MYFNKDFLIDIQKRINISDYIGRSIKLKYNGKEFVGLCPFHEEKTGSFTVNDSKRFYHCFGCGAHGNIFSFIKNSENVDFITAVKTLCSYLNIDVPKDNKVIKKANIELIQTMEIAANLYTYYLNNNNKTLEYLKERGLTTETIKSFQLGLSPDYKIYLTILKNKNIKTDNLLKLGIIRYNKENYFKNRLIIPIIDINNDVIGFGGRSLDNSQPKYLNSIESELFKKKQTLYGINKAINNISKKDRAIIVEGYMDVLFMHEYGFNETVASLGTSITSEQIDIIRKTTRNIFFCFDGDNAGNLAKSRLADKILPTISEGETIKFIQIKDNLDPEDILKKDGKLGMDKLINSSINLSEFILNKITHNIKDFSPEGRGLVNKQCLSYLDKIQNKSTRQNYHNFFKNEINQIFWRKTIHKKTNKKNDTGNIVKTFQNNALKEKVSKIIYLYPELLDYGEIEEIVSNLDIDIKLSEIKIDHKNNPKNENKLTLKEVKENLLSYISKNINFKNTSRHIGEDIRKNDLPKENMENREKVYKSYEKELENYRKLLKNDINN